MRRPWSATPTVRRYRRSVPTTSTLPTIGLGSGAYGSWGSPTATRGASVRCFWIRTATPSCCSRSWTKSSNVADRQLHGLEEQVRVVEGTVDTPLGSPTPCTPTTSTRHRGINLGCCFGAPLSAGLPHPALGQAHPLGSPADGKRGCGQASSLLLGAHACCAAPRVEIRPSDPRLAR